MTNTDLIIEEIQSSYRRYIDAFNGEDLDELAGFFSFPCGVLSGAHGMSVMKDQAEFVRVFGKMKARLKNEGWARTGIDTTHAWPTASDMALMVVDYTRYRDDATVLIRGRVCYTLRRDGGRWKIVTMSEVAEPYLGPGDIPR